VGAAYNGEHNEVNLREVSSALLHNPATPSSSLAVFLTIRKIRPNLESSSSTMRLAGKYFPGEDPIGKKIGDTSLTPKSIKEIIGVVEDIKDGSLDSEIWPAVYYPFNQSPDPRFPSSFARRKPSSSCSRPWLPLSIKLIQASAR